MSRAAEGSDPAPEPLRMARVVILFVAIAVLTGVAPAAAAYTTARATTSGRSVAAASSDTPTPGTSSSTTPARKPKKSSPVFGIVVSLVLVGAAFWVSSWARNRRRRRPE